MSTFVTLTVTALVIVGVAFPLVIFPILALVHCLRNPELTTQSKIGWGCLIFFTWVIGASIYGIVVSGRPFYKTMGIISLCLLFAALLVKKPLEKQRTHLETERNSLKAQHHAQRMEMLDRLKPIYDHFGMSKLWSLYQSGRCEEGNRERDANWGTYMQTVKAKGGNTNEAVLRKLTDQGLQLCEQTTQQAPN